MDIEGNNTKLNLINSAGELFAEYGLDGTSVRQIATKAGANVASINYHFGSKKNLYMELMRYLCSKEHKQRLDAIIEDNSQWLETKEGHARIVHAFVKGHIRHIFDKEHPEWHTKLWLKEITQPTEAMEVLISEFFMPEREALLKFLKKVKPGISEKECQYWHMFVPSHLLLYSLAQEPILRLSDMADFSDEYIETMVYFASRTFIQGLDLPFPGDLHIKLKNP